MSGSLASYILLIKGASLQKACNLSISYRAIHDRLPVDVLSDQDCEHK